MSDSPHTNREYEPSSHPETGADRSSEIPDGLWLDSGGQTGSATPNQAGAARADTALERSSGVPQIERPSGTDPIAPLRDWKQEQLQLLRWFGAVVATGVILVGLLHTSYQAGSPLHTLVYGLVSALETSTTASAGTGLETLVTFSVVFVTGLIGLMLRDPLQRVHGALLGAGTAVLLVGWWSLGHLPLPAGLTPQVGYTVMLGSFAAAATQLPELLRPEQNQYEQRFDQAAKAFFVLTAGIVLAAVVQGVVEGRLLPTLALGLPAVGFLGALYRFLQFETGLDVQLVADEGEGKTITLLLFRTAAEPYVEVPLDSPALGGILDNESQLVGGDGWPAESTIGGTDTVGFRFDVGQWISNRIDFSADDFPGGWLAAIAEYAEMPVWRLRLELLWLGFQHRVYTSALASVVGALPVGPTPGRLSDTANRLAGQLGPAACALNQVTSDHLFVGLDLEKWLTAVSGAREDAAAGHPLPIDELERIAKAAQKNGSTVHVLGLKADHMEPYWYELCHHNKPLNDELLSTLMEMIDHQAFTDGMIGDDLPELRREGAPSPESEYDVFRDLVTLILRQRDERIKSFLNNLDVDTVDPAYLKTTRDEDGEIIPKRQFGKLLPVGHREILKELEL